MLLSAVLAEAGDEEMRVLAARLRPYLAEDSARLLTAAEKAQQLGLHPDTLVRMAREGRVLASKVGRAWRFPAGAREIMAAHSPAPQRRPRPAAPRRGGALASVSAIRGG
jgi:excisionase family DNA binding protein